MTSLKNKLDNKVYDITYIIKENTKLSEVESYKLAQKIELFMDDLIYEVAKDFATQIVKELKGEIVEELVEELKNGAI